MRTALLDFALDVAHWPDKRFGDDGRPRSAAVTCLLIGTGAGGLPVGDALETILRAAVAWSVSRHWPRIAFGKLPWWSHPMWNS